MKRAVVLILGCLSCATASVAVATPQTPQTTPVTVQLTAAQHAAVVWAVANPGAAQTRPPFRWQDNTEQPTTVEAYLARVLTVTLRPLEALKVAADTKAVATERTLLDERLSKLTSAQCLRLASELGVTTDKLPCGASK